MLRGPRGSFPPDHGMGFGQHLTYPSKVGFQPVQRLTGTLSNFGVAGLHGQFKVDGPKYQFADSEKGWSVYGDANLGRLDGKASEKHHHWGLLTFEKRATLEDPESDATASLICVATIANRRSALHSPILTES